LGRARPHAERKLPFSFSWNLVIQKVPKETFWILTFSDAHVIGKLMPAALLRARASHIAFVREYLHWIDKL
jgi:formylmethanofuran dehydrogenase subunit E-like metal-binding protein